jgi:hypothetical protein
MTTIAIHHVRSHGRSVSMHTRIAVDIQGRGAFDLIHFRATNHVRLMPIGNLGEALEATST